MTGQSLAGITIHVDDKQFAGTVESNYTFQEILDATSEAISYYGAKSERISLNFILFEHENSDTGNSTLRAAVKANSDVNLTMDDANKGNFRILSYKYTRLQDLLHLPHVTYTCTAELVSTS